MSDLKQYSNTGTELWKKTSLGTVYYMPVTVGGLEIPNAQISINSKKQIVETSIAGREGTIKELISAEDYKISIEGLWISDTDDYPEDGIEDFRKLYNRHEAVELKCAMTDIFLQEDDKVVLTDFDCPKMQGKQNSQSITFNAISDKYYELEIN